MHTQLATNFFQLQIMVIVFITLNPAADYGSNGKWMLLVCTIIFWTCGFAAMGLRGVSNLSSLIYLFWSFSQTFSKKFRPVELASCYGTLRHQSRFLRSFSQPLYVGVPQSCKEYPTYEISSWKIRKWGNHT